MKYKVEQLKELQEMQRALDEAIFKEKGIEEYPVLNMKIALFVELGEMMNELPTKFKHWKSSAVDNREKALVEYVDALHFQLSLMNFHNLELSGDKWEMKVTGQLNQKYWTLVEKLTFCVDRVDTVYGILCLFSIADDLGFEWEEIYKTYIEKNRVNYERLASGY